MVQNKMDRYTYSSTGYGGSIPRSAYLGGFRLETSSEDAHRRLILVEPRDIVPNLDGVVEIRNRPC